MIETAAKCMYDFRIALSSTYVPLLLHDHLNLPPDYNHIGGTQPVPALSVREKFSLFEARG